MYSRSQFRDWSRWSTTLFLPAHGKIVNGRHGPHGSEQRKQRTSAQRLPGVVFRRSELPGKQMQNFARQLGSAVPVVPVPWFPMRRMYRCPASRSFTMFCRWATWAGMRKNSVDGTSDAFTPLPCADGDAVNVDRSSRSGNATHTPHTQTHIHTHPYTHTHTHTSQLEGDGDSGLRTIPSLAFQHRGLEM